MAYPAQANTGLTSHDVASRTTQGHTLIDEIYEVFFFIRVAGKNLWR